MERTAARSALPEWIRPQLTQLVSAAPDGDQWLHEIKYYGFRMHARLDRGEVRLLTRNGLDWTPKYPQIARAVSSLGAHQAYLDGELCGERPDDITSFSMIQLASDAGNAAGLVFFLFDLLYLDGEDLSTQPLIARKEGLADLLAQAESPLHYSDHQIGLGPAFYEKACPLGVEGIVSKRADAPYAPGTILTEIGIGRDRSTTGLGMLRSVSRAASASRIVRAQRSASGIRFWLRRLMCSSTVRPRISRASRP
jgi:ATP-dependent DNA ligase